MLTELQRDDMRRVIRSMPKHLLAMLKADRSVFMAGGCIRAIIANEEVADWDIFGPDRAHLEAFMALLQSAYVNEGTKARLYKTKNAITLLSPPRTPVQAITRWTYGETSHLINDFDLTVARAALWFDGNEWKSVCDHRFYADLAARRLTYCFPRREEDAGGSLLRAVKFLRKGYSISPEDLAGVVDRVARAVDWSRVGAGGMVLDAAITGGHMTSARVIAGILREVDPLTIIDGLDMRQDEDPNDPEARSVPEA